MAGDRARKRANELGARGEPFLFISDFEGRFPAVHSKAELAGRGIAFQVPGMEQPFPLLPEFSPLDSTDYLAPGFDWIEAVSEERYRRAFEEIQSAEKAGDAWLANLCFPNRVNTPYRLCELFQAACAPWKLYIRDTFACWSPECFIRIKSDETGKAIIGSWPMKGTHLQAQELLNDPKELAEHTTIVDLIRNDLGRVARDIRVRAFREPIPVETGRGRLWQTHSHIEGSLDRGWQGHIGDILGKLLPAGSVSGAPKDSVCALVARAEGESRGYYTGIFAAFDGRNLDSAVLIRAVQADPKRPGNLRYHAGGGITVYSDCTREYNELKEKIYVPLCRDPGHSRPKSLPALLSPSAFRPHEA